MTAATRDGRRPRPAEPRAIPAYRKVEASRYLRMSHRELHYWVSGVDDYYGEGPVAPLVGAADPARQRLSFENLLELHVLAALEHVKGINLLEARRALDFLQAQLGVARPLIDERMRTEGKTILVQRLEQDSGIDRKGRTSALERLDVHLDRIEWDPAGIGTRLFPFTRRRPRDRQAAEREPRLIAIDPGIALGRAAIAGSRVPTAEVAERYGAGDSIADLVADHALTAPGIEEAIRFELNLKA